MNKIVFCPVPAEQMTDIELIYSRVTLKELTSIYATFLDWKVFSNRIFKKFNSPHVLKDSDQIIVMGLDYLTNLTVIINEYKESPDKERTLKLFLVFHLIRFSLPLLSKEYRSQFNELGETLTGLFLLLTQFLCLIQFKFVLL